LAKTWMFRGGNRGRERERNLAGCLWVSQERTKRRALSTRRKEAVKERKKPIGFGGGKFTKLQK